MSQQQQKKNSLLRNIRKNISNEDINMLNKLRNPPDYEPGFEEEVHQEQEWADLNNLFGLQGEQGNG